MENTAEQIVYDRWGASRAFGLPRVDAKRFFGGLTPTHAECQMFAVAIKLNCREVKGHVAACAASSVQAVDTAQAVKRNAGPL